MLKKQEKHAFIMSCNAIFSFFMGNCPWICLISARDAVDRAWSAVFLVRWMTAAIDLHGFPAPFPCSFTWSANLIHDVIIHAMVSDRLQGCSVVLLLGMSVCSRYHAMLFSMVICFFCAHDMDFVNICTTSHNLYYVPFRWNFTISGFLHVYAECFCFCVFGFHKLGKLFPLSLPEKTICINISCLFL